MTWENLVAFFERMNENGDMYRGSSHADHLSLDGNIYRKELEEFVRDRAGSTPDR